MKCFIIFLIMAVMTLGVSAQPILNGLGSTESKNVKYIGSNQFVIQGDDGPIMTFHKLPGDDQSKVHIGKNEVTPASSDYNLYVEDGILSESMKIADPQDWSDFVFAENYALRSLDEVEKHIEEKKHLPDVPSEQELIDQGYYDQHEINKILLQKIEELTLYLIEQDKEIRRLRASSK